MSDQPDFSGIPNGAIICVRYGRRNIVQRLIERVQLRLLYDLELSPCVCLPRSAAFSASFTHTAMWHNVNGVQFVMEQTSPHARCVAPSEFFKPGNTYHVSYPWKAPQVLVDKAVCYMRETCVKREPYPLSELLSYYAHSWQRKLDEHLKFADVFASRHYNVCSGAVAHSLILAEALVPATLEDYRPEAWYPARFVFCAYDFDTLRLIRP